MNKIKLNDILHLNNEAIKNSKIELNMKEGQNGLPLIDKWLSLDNNIKFSGITDCSYWPWYGKTKNFEVGQKVFSFVRKDNDIWLFISAAIITEIKENQRAKVEILEEYKSFFGRMIMKFHKGNTYGRYVYDLSYLKNQEEIIEILPQVYNGEQFNGYDNVNLSYEKLNDILNKRIMPTYYEALKKITGIYCLTDTSNGKIYIGSASGEEGVKERWSNYLKNKHGGNKKLIELYKKNGDEYFRKYFKFTLLEYFNLSCDIEKIKKREQYWKQCFDTIRNGYNDN